MRARPVVMTMLACAAVGVAAWAFGVRVAQSVLIAAAAAAITAVAAVAMAPLTASVPWPEPHRPGVPASRRDVSQLSWTLRARADDLPPVAVLRLRRVAAHRLGRLGVDLDDPDDGPARRLLGDRALATLRAPTPSRPEHEATSPRPEHEAAAPRPQPAGRVGYADFVHAVDVVERLADLDRGDHRQPARPTAPTAPTASNVPGEPKP